MPDIKKYLNKDGLEAYNQHLDSMSNGYVRAFDTVAAMQAATDLKSGMVAHTNGFYAAGDGGAAYYTISASGTANGMDVLACANSLYATLIEEGSASVLQYGVRNDGESAVSLGTAVNYMMQKYDTVVIPDGTYDLGDTPILLQSSKRLEFGNNAVVNFSTSYCIDSIAMVSKAVVSGGKFINTSGTDRSGIAIYLREARDCEINSVYARNVDKGIVVDAGNTWAACNTIYNPYIFMFNYGIVLTSTSTKQVNNTVIFGGYLIDVFTDSTATAFLLEGAGDTNKCFGLAVEDCAIGYDSQSISANVPLMLVGCRAENIGTYIYRCNVNSQKNIIIGCNFNDQSSKMSIGARWNQDLDLHSIDNAFLKNDGNGIKFYDSGNNLRRFIYFDKSTNKMYLLPYGVSKVLVIGGTDSSQNPKEYIRAGGANGLVFPQGKLTLKSSTSNSSKYFEITVDDSGTISAAEVTLS